MTICPVNALINWTFGNTPAKAIPLNYTDKNKGVTLLIYGHIPTMVTCFSYPRIHSYIRKNVSKGSSIIKYWPQTITRPKYILNMGRTLNLSS